MSELASFARFFKNDSAFYLFVYWTHNSVSRSSHSPRVPIKIPIIKNYLSLYAALKYLRCASTRIGELCLVEIGIDDAASPPNLLEDRLMKGEL